MNDPRSAKQRLAGGDKLTGCWISLFSPIAAEMTAAAGYDVAMIDLEHGPGGFVDAIAMMQAVESRGVQPMVRSPDASATNLKRILDIGPMGMMVPGVRDADHARQIVGHCRYGPDGDRGAAPGYMRAMDYGGFGAKARTGDDYASFIANDFLLILQIESAGAVADADEIAALDGVDMIFIGPADLSADLGQLGGFDQDDFKAAMERVETATKKAGKPLGCIPFSDWSAERLYTSGYGLVLGGADAMLLAAAARQDADKLRAASLGSA